MYISKPIYFFWKKGGSINYPIINTNAIPLHPLGFTTVFVGSVMFIFLVFCLVF